MAERLQRDHFEFETISKRPIHLHLQYRIMVLFSTALPADSKKQLEVIEDLPGKPKLGSQSLLQLRVHGLRVFVGTFVLVAVLVAITAFFLVGVEITTLDSSELSDDERRSLLDRYNSYSGSITSVVSIPIKQFLPMLLPVFFLYFTTHAVLAKDKSVVMERSPVISLAVISYMIGLGLNSLNVQFGSPRLEFRISSTDLVGSQVDASNFTTLNYITSTAHTAGVPSTDTILRNAIVQSFEITETTCTDPGKKFNRKPEASIDIGFPLNTWLDSLLPKSIASVKSFNFSMKDNFTQRQVDPTQFPNGDVRKTASLLTSAFATMFAQFVSDGTTDITKYDQVLPPLLGRDLESPDAASLLTNIQNTIGNDRLLTWKDGITTCWSSMELSEVTIELSSF